MIVDRFIPASGKENLILGRDWDGKGQIGYNITREPVEIGRIQRTKCG
jgi:hypothetical protein